MTRDERLNVQIRKQPEAVSADAREARLRQPIAGFLDLDVSPRAPKPGQRQRRLPRAMTEEEELHVRVRLLQAQVKTLRAQIARYLKNTEMRLQHLENAVEQVSVRVDELQGTVNLRCN
jgi:hypothetical protein